MEFKATKKKISLIDIENLEAKYKFKFSADFKKHYLANNGGYPKNTVYPTKKNSYLIDEFLSIKYGKDNEFSETLELISDVLPKNIIPFAIDPFGNYFCFDQKGAIFFWDHEKAAEDPKKSVLKLSNNLSEFLASLTKE